MVENTANYVKENTMSWFKLPFKAPDPNPELGDKGSTKVWSHGKTVFKWRGDGSGEGSLEMKPKQGVSGEQSANGWLRNVTRWFG